MLTYLLRRVLLFVPTLLGATMLVFAVVAMAPGGIEAIALSNEGNLRPEQRKAREEYLNKRYGLKDPLPVQYLRWLNKVLPVGMKTAGEGWPAALPFGLKWPDLGESILRGRRVSSLVAQSLPITLLLNVISLPISYILAIVTGVLAGRARGKAVDVVSGTVSLALWSLPVIWVAVLFIGFLANDNYLHWFPANGLSDLEADRMAFLPTFAGGWRRGWLLDFLWHLVLPVVCLSYGNLAFLHKLARGALLDTIGADYVRTARAKGVPESRVLWSHAFRNSLLPLITVAAGLLPSMILGSVVVEYVFGIDGMGRLLVQAVEQRDRELFLSLTLLIMVLTLVGYLIADVAYVIADPRVSYE